MRGNRRLADARLHEGLRCQLVLGDSDEIVSSLGVRARRALSDYRLVGVAWHVGGPDDVGAGDGGGETAATLTLTSGTDNQGNSFLLDRMMTTKYPAVVISWVKFEKNIEKKIARNADK